MIILQEFLDQSLINSRLKYILNFLSDFEIHVWDSMTSMNRLYALNKKLLYNQKFFRFREKRFNFVCSKLVLRLFFQRIQWKIRIWWCSLVFWASRAFKYRSIESKLSAVFDRMTLRSHFCDFILLSARRIRPWKSFLKRKINLKPIYGTF